MKFSKVAIYLLISVFIISMPVIAFFIVKKDKQLQGAMLEVGKKMKDFIYNEATIHNPEGDVLPDGIDDSIISKIKRF